MDFCISSRIAKSSSILATIRSCSLKGGIGIDSLLKSVLLNLLIAVAEDIDIRRL